MNTEEERPDLNEEEPQISIVWDDDEQPPQSSASQPTAPKQRNWGWKVCAVLLSLIVVCGAWRFYQYFFNLDLPVAVSPGQNVAKLAKEAKKSDNPGVVMTRDSIHGVALNLYSLSGLQATLSVHEPAPTDTDVMLYCRSADYYADGTYMGDLVIDGEKKNCHSSMLLRRLGYCGMANGNVVIGVSYCGKVMDYCIEHGGSFFRQFALLSDGELPRKFLLHGRVERCALARLEGGTERLYFVTTRHKESLVDFADALRGYGFTDAIYITGGSSYFYYRDQEGNLNFMGDPNEHPLPEHMPFVPWLVFRAR